MDGRNIFRVYDGEPEDANLNRDFSPCWSIPDLLKIAWKVGKKGESFKITNVQVDEF